ncbi:MAG TPA: class I SAM-dependent methyltransferase [Candidatus Hydrogenedentes bacterium]|nr:class I SAM-dependent methyltransferase [Candidatus Hydrogenedentota bacterium]HIJ73854.1 class I SAM-dependent methyltransferase [Candidatus Hydrogenedentota bacterium]
MFAELRKKTGKLLAFGAGVCRGALRRARYCGWKSAWIHVRAALTDFYIRQREKAMRAPRVECPCCGWTGYDFYSMDGVFFYLPHVHCPQCRGCERHRMLQLYISRHDAALLERAGCVLHVAPDREGNLRALIEHGRRLRVFATDMQPRMLEGQPGPRFLSDVRRLPVKSGSFDAVFCIHVLEHIREDKAAIAELHRILRPGGVAYIMAPFVPGISASYARDEPDPIDHIWMYATNDFKHRLNCFQVEEITPKSFLSPAEIRRHRIPDREIIYRCVKG